MVFTKKKKEMMRTFTFLNVILSFYLVVHQCNFDFKTHSRKRSKENNDVKKSTSRYHFFFFCISHLFSNRLPRRYCNKKSVVIKSERYFTLI